MPLNLIQQLCITGLEIGRFIIHWPLDMIARLTTLAFLTVLALNLSAREPPDPEDGRIKVLVEKLLDALNKEDKDKFGDLFVTSEEMWKIPDLTTVNAFVRPMLYSFMREGYLDDWNTIQENGKEIEWDTVRLLRIDAMGESLRLTLSFGVRTEIPMHLITGSIAMTEDGARFYTRFVVPLALDDPFKYH